MRSAVILLAAMAAVAAEAPYHLPRPAPHAPAFVYPHGPAPPPPPPPPAPFPQLPQRPQQPFAPHPHPPAPPPSFNPNQGYNYQQPSFGPAFVYPQLAPQPIPAHPAPPPVYSVPQPAPQPIPVHPPSPVYVPAPHPRPVPIPHPPAINYPQPYPLPVPQPQPVHYPAPQPLPVHYPAPQPQPLPISYPQPQPQPIAPPQTSYGVPQPQPQPQPQPLPVYHVPQAPVAPIAPLPAPLPQQPQAPQPFTSSNHAVIAHHHQQLASQGYSYPQSISQSTQFAAPLPLQSQPLTNNHISSYQSDSNQYSSQNEIHREALDETVVDRVQNIITENEHSSAKQAGYLSLVSGVSLENARPSVELLSFVHTSPQDGAGSIDVRTASSGGSSSSSTANLSSYDAPISGGSSQSSDSSASVGFLPNTRPSISYGVPN